MKLTTRELVRRALEDAIGWQEGLIDAHSDMKDDPAYTDAVELRDAYRALLSRRYGPRLDPFKGAKRLGLDELHKLPPNWPSK